MLHNPQLLKLLTKLMSTVSPSMLGYGFVTLGVSSQCVLQCIIFANHTDRFTKTLTMDLDQVRTFQHSVLSLCSIFDRNFSCSLLQNL